MKCKKTHQQCPYALPICAQDGWRFIGCTFPPYKGKPVDEIGECPKLLEQKMSNTDIDKYMADLYHLARNGKDISKSLSDLFCRAIKASRVNLADGTHKISIELSGTISIEITAKDEDIDVKITDDTTQFKILNH
ncbi:MAG: hypothetical protein J5651_00415 [Salinivirgaceae bacterium]|nr:hypothetical protein [Salinivirgaceae bacterium]